MREKTDAILVRPPEPIMETWYDYAESLGIGYIASYARSNGFKVEIIDAVVEKKGIDYIVDKVLESDALIVGFSVFQVAFKNTVVIAEKLREKGYNKHITLGGHFPTFSAHDILKDFKCFDSIVAHEGEKPFTQLIANLKNNVYWKNINNLIYIDNNKIVANPVNPLIKNLDELPFPARDKFKDAFKVNKTISISTSRGCWNNCSFCTVTAFYDKPDGSRWRGRSVENILNEISYLQKKFSYNSFTIIDDNFFGPGANGKQRVIKFAKQLIENNININYSIECRVDDVDEDIFRLLKKSGLKAVFLGIENGDNNVLRRYNKRATVQDNEKAIKILESLDLGINAGFILFDPFITLDEIKRNISFLKKYNFFDLTTLLRKLELRNGMAYRKKIENSALLIGNQYEADYFFNDKLVNKFYNLIQISLANFAPPYFLLREIKNKKELSFDVLNEISQKINQSALKCFEDILLALDYDNNLSEKSESFIKIDNSAKKKGLFLYKVLKFSSLVQ